MSPPPPANATTRVSPKHAAFVLTPTSALFDVLSFHAQHRAHAGALRFDGDQITYARMHVLSLTMLGQLLARGIQAGDRVAYLGLNHPLQIILLFALARLGAMLVPLNYRLAHAELCATLRDCTPRWLVCDLHWEKQGWDLVSSMATTAPITCIALDALTAAQEKDALAHYHGQASDPALLVYTSGTTGMPKGAVHTQRNLLANMALASATQDMTADDLVLTVLPLFHVGGLCIQTLPALFVGAQVIVHPRFEAKTTLDCIQSERPGLTLQVPATLQALIEHPHWQDTDLSGLRAVWAGSSLLPESLLQAFHARAIPVCNVYGSTESGPFSIALPPVWAQSHLGSCGWPVHTQNLTVELRLQQPQDEVGELCLRGPNVVSHYWPCTAATDGDGFLHTGDLARQAPDGSITIVGRAKDMLISGGENIYPAEIENILLTHPLVADCAIVGLPDAQWGEIAVACVVLRQPTSSTLDVQDLLQTLLAQRLARYKLPRHWLWLTELPKTALGKVQKNILAQLVSTSRVL